MTEAVIVSTARTPRKAYRGALNNTEGPWSRREPLDLTLGEIASLDCQVYDAWCGFFGCRFHADKLCLCVSYCTRYTHLLHSQIETLRPTGSARALSLRRAAAMTAGRATTGGFIGPTPAFQRGQAHQ